MAGKLIALLGFVLLLALPGAGRTAAFLQEATGERPAFSVFLYPPWPGVTTLALDEPDWCNFERVKAYFDPILSLDSSGAVGEWARRYGFHVLIHPGASLGAAICGRGKPSADFCARHKDWAERFLDGKHSNHTCLANPALYPYLSRRFEDFVQRLKDSPGSEQAVGIYLESEPSMGAWGEVEHLGGNPHTVKLFQEYLAKAYGDIKAFNQAAGTSFTAFEQIQPSDGNLVVQAWLHRFRPWLVGAYYQGTLAATCKRLLPDLPLATRWVDAPGFSSHYDSDWSYWDQVKTDWCGFTCYPQVSRFLGQVATEVSFASAYAKPVLLAEFGAKRGEKFVPLSPEAVRCVAWRELGTPLKLYTFFAWALPNDPGGISLYSNGPLLEEVRRLRADFDQLEPSTTLGEAHKPFALVVSRNAFWLPGAEDAFYGGVLRAFFDLLNEPETDLFEVMEAHSPKARRLLQACPYKALFLVDAACEKAGVIKQLERKPPAPLVVFRWSRNFDYLFTPGPESLPFAHPLAFERKVTWPEATRSLTLAHTTMQGNALEWKGEALYVQGLPAHLEDWRTLVKLLCARWQVKQPVVHYQQFESGAVLVNWSQASPGARIAEAKVPSSGLPWAFKAGCPWLCYTEKGKTLQLQGLYLPQKGVEAVYTRQAAPRPHLELKSGRAGFINFTLTSRLLEARLRALEATHVVLALKPQGRTVWYDWSQGPFTWRLSDESGKLLAQGKGTELAFDLPADGDFTLVIENKGPRFAD